MESNETGTEETEDALDVRGGWHSLKCFVCSEDVRNEDFLNVPFHEEGAALLCHILEVPHLEYTARFMQFSYCYHCRRMLQEIRSALDELERLEKIVLERKDELRELMRETCFARQHFPWPENMEDSSVLQFREEIIAGLNSKTLLTLFSKLNENRIGKQFYEPLNSNLPQMVLEDGYSNELTYVEESPMRKNGKRTTSRKSKPKPQVIEVEEPEPPIEILRKLDHLRKINGITCKKLILPSTSTRIPELGIEQEFPDELPKIQDTSAPVKSNGNVSKSKRARKSKKETEVVNGDEFSNELSKIQKTPLKRNGNVSKSKRARKSKKETEVVNGDEFSNELSKIRKTPVEMIENISKSKRSKKLKKEPEVVNEIEFSNELSKIQKTPVEMIENISKTKRSKKLKREPEVVNEVGFSEEFSPVQESSVKMGGNISKSKRSKKPKTVTEMVNEVEFYEEFPPAQESPVKMNRNGTAFISMSKSKLDDPDVFQMEEEPFTEISREQESTKKMSGIARKRSKKSKKETQVVSEDELSEEFVPAQESQVNGNGTPLISKSKSKLDNPDVLQMEEESFTEIRREQRSPMIMSGVATKKSKKSKKETQVVNEDEFSEEFPPTQSPVKVNGDGTAFTSTSKSKLNDSDVFQTEEEPFTEISREQESTKKMSAIARKRSKKSKIETEMVGEVDFSEEFVPGPESPVKMKVNGTALISRSKSKLDEPDVFQIEEESFTEIPREQESPKKMCGVASKKSKKSKKETQVVNEVEFSEEFPPTQSPVKMNRNGTAFISTSKSKLDDSDVFQTEEESFTEISRERESRMKMSGIASKRSKRSKKETEVASEGELSEEFPPAQESPVKMNRNGTAFISTSKSNLDEPHVFQMEEESFTDISRERESPMKMIEVASTSKRSKKSKKETQVVNEVEFSEEFPPTQSPVKVNGNGTAFISKSKSKLDDSDVFQTEEESFTEISRERESRMKMSGVASKRSKRSKKETEVASEGELSEEFPPAQESPVKMNRNGIAFISTSKSKLDEPEDPDVFQMEEEFFTEISREQKSPMKMGGSPSKMSKTSKIDTEINADEFSEEFLPAQESPVKMNGNGTAFTSTSKSKLDEPDVFQMEEEFFTEISREQKSPMKMGGSPSKRSEKSKIETEVVNDVELSNELSPTQKIPSPLLELNGNGATQPNPERIEMEDEPSQVQEDETTPPPLKPIETSVSTEILETDSTQTRIAKLLAKYASTHTSTPSTSTSTPLIKKSTILQSKQRKLIPPRPIISQGPKMKFSFHESEEPEKRGRGRPPRIQKVSSKIIKPKFKPNPVGRPPNQKEDAKTAEIPLSDETQIPVTPTLDNGMKKCQTQPEAIQTPVDLMNEKLPLEDEEEVTKLNDTNDAAGYVDLNPKINEEAGLVGKCLSKKRAWYRNLDSPAPEETPEVPSKQKKIEREKCVKERTSLTPEKTPEVPSKSKKIEQKKSPVKTKDVPLKPKKIERKKSPGKIKQVPSKPQKIERKKWVKEKTYLTADSAEEAVQLDGFWMEDHTLENSTGKKVYYSCGWTAKGKFQCDAGLYLLYDSESSKVALFRALAFHGTHVKDRYNGISEANKKLIQKIYMEGVTAPQDIVKSLKRLKIKDVVTSPQVSHYLQLMCN